MLHDSHRTAEYQNTATASVSAAGPGRRCVYQHPSGQQCGGFAVSTSAYCFAHDPASARKRDEARRRGGSAGRMATLPAADVAVRSFADVVTVVEATINDVRAGRLDVKIANAVAVLSGVALKAIGQSDLETRLAALEAALEPRRADEVQLRKGSRS